MVALPIFIRMRIISQTCVWEYKYMRECLFSQIITALWSHWRWPTLEALTCVLRSDMLSCSFIAQLFHFSHINTLRQCVLQLSLSLNTMTLGEFYSRGRYEGRSQWKSHVYDKNSIFIIPNLHRDAPFNLPPTALSPQATQCTREMQHFCPDTCTEHPESLRA